MVILIKHMGKLPTKYDAIIVHLVDPLVFFFFLNRNSNGKN